MNSDAVQIFVMNGGTSSDKLDRVDIKSGEESPENVEDITKICRICATVTDLVIPIFEGEGLQNNLADKIHKHLPIKVSERDVLPHVVCYQCCSTVLAWHELVQCCQQADHALQQRAANRDRKTNEVTETKSDPKWIPSRETYSERGPFKIELDEPSHDKDAGDDGALSDDDDKPLAAFAAGKSADLYGNFYRALVNFRDHFVKHQEKRGGRSDFSDSSDSVDEKARRESDVSRYDDLTNSNMRKDKMDEQTRLEIGQVQTKINGKTYFTCKICDKKLSSSHTYIFHKRIHTGERPCVCHVCGKQFRAPNGLQRHLTETHERTRHHSCPLCHKSFANSQNLKQHTRIHTGERPFACPHCGKRFTQSGSLHVHLKTHSALLPHACRDCGAQFRMRSGLTRHRLKHTGERPHECGHCGKGFRQKHELNAHSLTHSDAKPHACALCGAAFRQRRALRHHCRRLHQDRGAVAAHVYGDALNYILTLDGA